MKLHHLQTAFLVICWVLVCSQGRSQEIALFDPIDYGPIKMSGVAPISDVTTDINNTYSNANLNILGNTLPFNPYLSLAASDSSLHNLTSNSGSSFNIIIQTDPAVPEPTTLSLLAMSLLFARRRWR